MAGKTTSASQPNMKPALLAVGIPQTAHRESSRQQQQRAGYRESAEELSTGYSAHDAAADSLAGACLTAWPADEPYHAPNLLGGSSSLYDILTPPPTPT